MSGVLIDPITGATVHFSGAVVATCSGQRRAALYSDRDEIRPKEGGGESEDESSDEGSMSTSSSTSNDVNNDRTGELWDNRLMVWSL